jgi:hypothetical protein
MKHQPNTLVNEIWKWRTKQNFERRTSKKVYNENLTKIFQISKEKPKEKNKNKLETLKNN